MTIYNALENLFKKFMYDSKEKFQKYTQLMEINAKSTKSIEESIKRIKKIKTKIKLISLKILQTWKEFELKNQKIWNENNEIASNFLSLKKKMFEFRNDEKKKLVVLINESR